MDDQHEWRDPVPVFQSRRVFLRACILGAAVSAAPWERTWSLAPAMRTILSDGFGRAVILSFDRGEKLREGIRDRLKELGIRNAVLVSAVGTLEKARFSRTKTTGQQPQNEIFELGGPIELASVDGLVADGEPHFHASFEVLGRPYAAHLEDGSVVYQMAEVVLAELKGVQLTRLHNANRDVELRQKP